MKGLSAKLALCEMSFGELDTRELGLTLDEYCHGEFCLPWPTRGHGFIGHANAPGEMLLKLLIKGIIKKDWTRTSLSQFPSHTFEKEIVSDENFSPSDQVENAACAGTKSQAVH